MAFAVTKQIRLDISYSGCSEDIWIKQYDGGIRELLAVLTDGGSPFSVPTSYGASLYAHRPNGSEGAVTCDIENDGLIRIPITSWLTTYAGRVSCELRITDGSGNWVSSLSFYMMIEDGIDPDTATSGSDSPSTLRGTGWTTEQIELLEKVLNGLVYADTDSATASDAISAAENLIASLKGSASETTYIDQISVANGTMTISSLANTPSQISTFLYIT